MKDEAKKLSYESLKIKVKTRSYMGSPHNRLVLECRDQENSVGKNCKTDETFFNKVYEKFKYVPLIDAHCDGVGSNSKCVSFYIAIEGAHHQS